MVLLLELPSQFLERHAAIILSDYISKLFDRYSHLWEVIRIQENLAALVAQVPLFTPPVAAILKQVVGVAVLTPDRLGFYCLVHHSLQHSFSYSSESVQHLALLPLLVRG